MQSPAKADTSWDLTTTLPRCWHTPTHLDSPANSQVLCITWKQEDKVLEEVMTTGLWLPFLLSWPANDCSAKGHHSFPAAHSYTLPLVPTSRSGPNPAESCFCCPLNSKTQPTRGPGEDESQGKRHSSSPAVRAGPPLLQAACAPQGSRHQTALPVANQTWRGQHETTC